jgi:single-strand DNA-binding protein
VSKQDTTSTRFTAQDWMYADRDVWVYDESNTENYKYGYRPSFAVNGGSYSYDTAIRAEGTASLRMDFSGNFTVSPILTYPQVQAQKWGKFNTLSVSLLNPSKQAVTLSLTLTSGSKTYNVPLLDGSDTITLRANQTAFAVYTFDLSGITLNGSKVANFSLVTDLLYKSKEGLASSETTWHNIVVWEGKDTPDLDKITKGEPVNVIGRRRVSRYTSADGTEKQFYEVLAGKVTLLRDSQN